MFIAGENTRRGFEDTPFSPSRYLLRSPAGATSALWGARERVTDMLGDRQRYINTQKRSRKAGQNCNCTMMDLGESSQIQPQQQ
jgi:hypothetical protein